MSQILPKGISNEIVDSNNLVSAFLSGRKASTIAAYRQDLQEFRQFLKVESIDDAAKTLLTLPGGHANALALKYKIYLIDELKLQSATVNRRLAALRSLVKMARTLGLVSWSLEVENRINAPYRDVRGVGSEGIKSMLQLLEGETDIKSIRDYAILRLLYDLGLRREEVCTLEIGDLNLSQSSIRILGKGRTEKENLNLPAPTAAALIRWISTSGSRDGALFFRLDKAAGSDRKRLTGTGLYSIIKDLGSRAGIKDMTVHKIRHSAITTCCQVIAEHNLGIETLLKFSRHKNLNTALVYFDHLENKQGLLANLVAKKTG